MMLFIIFSGYGVYRFLIVGDGVPAPLCGVLPMVALTPKGVRYLGVPFIFAFCETLFF